MGEEDAVKTAVGNGASVEDGEACGAFAGGDHVADAVPGEAGTQFGEFVRGVTAAEQVEYAIECGARESAKRGGAADQIVKEVDRNFGLGLFA